ncbi:ABC transporter permease [Brevibacterium sp. BDJS002]|uniref:ABC transporter permease n=1 Tax=Brevibacterium picturae TaxID=260553 RepID=A0ABN2AY22_9MICO|nr:ABC transporter permease [Brevibacterium sp. BDJS002]MDN5775033.1 ABC transporter permease [Brevibacterium aurantiacum]WCE41530.1 ABC transporter permease [Brevibacterium sp. BDJS002]
MQTRILATSDSAETGPEAEPAKGAPKPSLKQALLAAVFAAAIVTIILLAFSWPTVTSEPKDLPVAAVGDQKQIDQITANAPEGMLDLKKVDSRAEAQQLIREREVYGAFIVGDEPEILTSTAASPAVAQQLNGIASQMQQKIDKQAMSGMQDGMKEMQDALAKASQGPASQSPASQGPAGPQENPGEQAQAPTTSAMEVPQVTVTDVVPLNDNDSTGAGLAIAGLPLTIGGIVGGVLTSMIVHSRRMRAVAVLAYGAIGGLALTLVLQSWFGILQGNFGLNVLAAGLAVAATAALINGFVSLIGPGGIAIGAVLTMFIGNPIASLQAPKEFLAGAWGDIGQFLVPGASGTLLRDLSYFPDAPMAMQWWVLIGWFVLGIALILVGHLLAHSKKRAAVS